MDFTQSRAWINGRPAVVIATLALASFTPLVGDAGMQGALARSGPSAYSPVSRLPPPGE